MTLDDWVRAHAFLEPLARVRASVDAAIDAAAVPDPPTPDWDDYRADFLAGVPLLHSAAAAIDLDPAGDLIVALTRRLAAEPFAGTLAEDMRALDAELTRDSVGARRVVDWLLGDESWTPSRPGPLRYVGWLAVSSALRPAIDAFAGWRDDEKWLRRYCPGCGSLPAMAHLVGTDPGRRRFLSCGCCGTRWRYGRTECPFCEVKSDRLASLAIDGESGLRIDYCQSCRGYLKTYDGHGSEAILLADWTSLHLDLAARDRGLQRLASSLYELEGASAPS